MMLTFTDAAVEKIRSLHAKEGGSPVALRVFLAPGGCSGLSYGMTWEAEKKDADTEPSLEDVRILLDPSSTYLLRNVTVDYHDSLMQSGFDFINPDAKSTCGCGTSFSSEEVPGEPGNCETAPSHLR